MVEEMNTPIGWGPEGNLFFDKDDYKVHTEVSPFG
jgi:hypothetical protein